MKKAILILSLALISAASFAQSKTDTTKKAAAAVPSPTKPVPQFSTDNIALKHVDPALNLKLQTYQLGDYFTIEQYGESTIAYSDRISARAYTTMRLNHRLVDSMMKATLFKQYNSFIDAEKKHFDDSVKMASDTLGKPKPKAKNH